MTTTQILIVGLGAIGVFAVLGAFVIAFRRGSSPGQDWSARLPRGARKADRSALDRHVEVAADSPEVVADDVDEGSAPVPAMAGAPAMAAVQVQTVEELSPEEAGVSRRMFLTRALGGVFGAFLGLFGLTSLAFLWPRLSGGFGSDIDVGLIDDLHAAIVQPDGSVIPAFIPEARAYVVPFDPALIAGSQFSDNVVAEGLTALFQRCVHLGCRVPWCASSQGFECPCHGSKYNFVGEYKAGPAPRNLDRFELEVVANRLIVKTSRIIQTARAPVDTVPYPQGPSCISLAPAEG